MEILDSVLQMLAYELAAIFALLSLWLFIRDHKKTSRINEAAAKLVHKLKRNKEKRMGTLSELLAKKYGLQGDALQQLASEFQEREQQLYKSLLKLYIEQDGKLLLNYPQQLESLLDESLKLHPVGGEDNHTMAIDESLPLNEQIEQTARKLEVLMAQFRQLNGDQAYETRNEQQSDEGTTENDEIEVVSEGHKAGVDDTPIEENDSDANVEITNNNELASEADEDKIDIEISSGEFATQETEQGNNEEQEVEIEVVEVEENVNDKDEITDEVDEALVTTETDVELSDDEVNGIDLSAVDDVEAEEGEVSVKKSESDAESTVQEEDDETLEAAVEKDAYEPQQVTDIEQTVENSQSSEETLPSNVKQSDALKSTDLEPEPEVFNTEMEIDIEASIESEGEAESDHDTDASEENEDTVADEPRIDTSNEQTEIETQDISKIEGEPQTEPSSNTEDTSDVGQAKKGMQAYLKKDWNHSIPDIYGAGEDKEENEQENQQAIRNSEIKITSARDNEQTLNNEITDIAIDKDGSEFQNTHQSEVGIEFEASNIHQSEMIINSNIENGIDHDSVVMESESQTENGTQVMENLIQNPDMTATGTHVKENATQLEQNAESGSSEGEEIRNESSQNENLTNDTSENRHVDTKNNDDDYSSTEVNIIEPHDKLEPESKASLEIELDLSSAPNIFSSEEEYLTARMQTMSGDNNKEEVAITDDNIEHSIVAETQKESEDETRFVEPTEALSDMVMDFTQEYYEPLPSESEFESMLSEIRELEQDPSLLEKEPEQDNPVQDELQAILSSIPSFSEINKK